MDTGQRVLMWVVLLVVVAGAASAAWFLRARGPAGVAVDAAVEMEKFAGMMEGIESEKDWQEADGEALMNQANRAVEAYETYDGLTQAQREEVPEEVRERLIEAERRFNTQQRRYAEFNRADGGGVVTPGRAR